jgi:hypothetical protein
MNWTSCNAWQRILIFIAVCEMTCFYSFDIKGIHAITLISTIDYICKQPAGKRWIATCASAVTSCVWVSVDRLGRRFRRWHGVYALVYVHMYVCGISDLLPRIQELKCNTAAAADKRAH